MKKVNIALGKLQKTKYYVLFTTILFLSFSFTIQAATIFVKHDATGTNDGTSWTNAYTDLLVAITNASNGDEIWIAAGTYKPTTGTDRDISFNMKNGVGIYGGFNGTETLLSERNPNTNVTILSGDIGVTGDNSDNSYHVFNDQNLDNTATMDGITIEDGNANGSGVLNGVRRDLGGGMFLRTSNPVITNCVFKSNNAKSGGAIRNNSSTPTITACSFTNNTCTEDGAALYNNISSPIITNCDFSNNSAGDDGGAAFNTRGNPIYTNCTFTSNSATAFGGAILNNSNSSTQSTPVYNNCIFKGNQASNGGASSARSSSASVVRTISTFNNCIFIGNLASSGGVFYSQLTGSATLNNCSLSGNTATNGGCLSTLNTSDIITNSILWGNSSQIQGSPTVTFSIVEGGFTGTGNLSTDPNFTDQPPIGLGTTGDLHLDVNSTAYNSGDNASIPSGNTTDLDGNGRINFGIVDMGAYEAQSVLLPVELVFFRAQTKEHLVLLNWETASELNNYGFEIQRSQDGKDWIVIGFVNGEGTTNKTSNYQYQDHNPQNGINYYRLRQIDYDGQFEYSNIETTNFSKQINFKIYPNPTSGKLTINSEENIPTSLINNIGKVIWENRILESEIDISHLPNGTYYLKVHSETAPTIKKVFKQ